MITFQGARIDHAAIVFWCVRCGPILAESLDEDCVMAFHKEENRCGASPHDQPELVQ